MTDVKKMLRAVETYQKMLADGERALRDELIKQIREIQSLDEISDPTLARILLRAKGQGVDVAGHLVRTEGVMTAPKIESGKRLEKIAFGLKSKRPLGMSRIVKIRLLDSIINELESREKNMIHDEAVMLRAALGI